MGIPKTGVFGLYDLIGIDLMSDVVKSLVSILPPDDPFHAVAGEIPLMTEMITNGQTGNKQGRGFYLEDEATGARHVLNFENGAYEPFERLILPLAEDAEQNGFSRLLKDDSVYGHFAWQVLSRTLSYAASLIPEVGDDPVGIDDAMKLGYNWLSGPFEMIDEIGPGEFVTRLEYEKRAVPPYLRSARDGSFYRVDAATLESLGGDGSWQPLERPSGVVRFNEKRQTLKAENSNEMASWYVSDEAALVEFHSKANALDGESMAVLADAIDQAGSRKFKGLVVHNDAQHFSCGVNLGTVRGYFETEDMTGLDRFLDHFQQTVLAMRNAEFPVVVAPVGLSLGGGFEVVLHGKQVISHANSVMGLVESLVGVIPSGGGCKEILYRWVEKLNCGTDISEASWKAFMNIGFGVTATSPVLASGLAMTRPNDRYEMNRDRLYSAAISALDSGEGEIFRRPELAMPGREIFEKMQSWLHKAHQSNRLTPHDVVVGTEIARIVTGGEIEPGSSWAEQDLLDAERAAFLFLVSTESTRERIATMLDRGKPVRN
jgi:3-hydroxyacyl-CoA dehydrogenase